MSITARPVYPDVPRLGAIQPGWLRLVHWLNVLAVVVMVASGWRIYNVSPLFDFHFPNEYTLGGWLGGRTIMAFRRHVVAGGQWPCISAAEYKKRANGPAARWVHFVTMSLLVLFIVVHVAMAVLVPQTLRTMIMGR